MGKQNDKDGRQEKKNNKQTKSEIQSKCVRKEMARLKFSGIQCCVVW
jgi:hypothetical protein